MLSKIDEALTHGSKFLSRESLSVFKLFGKISAKQREGLHICMFGEEMRAGWWEAEVADMFVKV